MQVLIVLMLFGVGIVMTAVAFFVWTAQSGTFDHADRLALLPLEDSQPKPDSSKTGHSEE